MKKAVKKPPNHAKNLKKGTFKPKINIKNETITIHKTGLALVKLTHGLRILIIGAFFKSPYGISIEKTTFWLF